jgi:hypothetical protein
MFGVAGGWCLAQGWNGSFGIFVGFICYCATIQLVIVKAFQIRGHADAYVEKYSKAVYKSADDINNK